MFKENRQFWLYFLGIILMFFMLFLVLRSGFFGSSLIFSSFPFDLLGGGGNIIDPATTQLQRERDYQAILRTNLGEITIELFEESAPNTVANFINLANSDHYNLTRFHRLEKGLLVQGGSRTSRDGDPTNDRYGNPGYTIPDEMNWESLGFSEQKKQELQSEGYSSTSGVQSRQLGRFSVAMASNGPNTAGSQFMIILAENDDPRVIELQGRHTVFGHVIGGFTVLQKLQELELEEVPGSAPRPERFTIYSVIIRVKE